MTKFKVGDKVVITYEDFIDYMGKIYTVVSIENELAWINLFNKDTKNAVEDFWIRKATKLELALQ